MSYKKDIQKIAEGSPGRESCGLIVLDNYQLKVLEMPNTHYNKKKYFKISLGDFLEAQSTYQILAIFHSHVSVSEKPSQFDIKSCEELCLPFLIYSLKSKKFFLHFPDSYEPPHINGRIYIEDLHECTCLVKDYYHTELGINIAKWIKNYCIPRDPKRANTLLKKVFSKNLIEVKDLKKHDIIIFKFSDKKVMHAGVYIGDEIFIHQRTNQISSRTFLDNRWSNKIYRIYRHPSLV